MNYRHIYHAGNFADVVKHTTLLLLLERLARKPEPYCYLDTHAGIGLYDLTSTEARKTGESAEGVGRLLAAQGLPPVLADYLALVRGFNPDGALRRYPGSPALALARLRPQDRAVLMELHPADAERLKAAFRDEPRAAVHHINGYHGLKAFLPPRERRGLVLVDPPFEVVDEFSQMVEGLKIAHRRWHTGVYALWYPIKGRREVRRFHDALSGSGIRKLLRAEFRRYPEDLPERLNGCGMIIVNPPWQLDADLAALYAALVPLLAAPGDARVTVDWLVPE